MSLPGLNTSEHQEMAWISRWWIILILPAPPSPFSWHKTSLESKAEIVPKLLEDVTLSLRALYRGLETGCSYQEPGIKEQARPGPLTLPLLPASLPAHSCQVGAQCQEPLLIHYQSRGETRTFSIVCLWWFLRKACKGHVAIMESWTSDFSGEKHPLSREFA